MTQIHCLSTAAHLTALILLNIIFNQTYHTATLINLKSILHLSLTCLWRGVGTSCEALPMANTILAIP